MSCKWIDYCACWNRWDHWKCSQERGFRREWSCCWPCPIYLLPAMANALIAHDWLLCSSSVYSHKGWWKWNWRCLLVLKARRKCLNFYWLLIDWLLCRAINCNQKYTKYYLQTFPDALKNIILYLNKLVYLICSPEKVWLLAQLTPRVGWAQKWDNLN